jgi:murein DD-endopeptidase MepM/ murein hydrolase activator NlpD
MIGCDYVDKSVMKDIITAQQVQGRSKPSLLSAAKKYRVLSDNSFIADQHLPKQKKKRLLEQVRDSYKQQTVSLKRKKTDKIQALTIPPISEQELPQEVPLSLKITGGRLIRFPKQHFFGLLIGLASITFFLIVAINYIPIPDPPEDSVVLEQPERPVSVVDDGDEIPLDLTETFAWQSYTVRRGDTVEGISRRFGLSLDAVIASNNLRNVRHLRAEEKLRIPNMDGIPHTVKKEDSYTKIASSYGVPLEAILDANDIQDDFVIPGTVLFIPGAKMDKNELRRALGQFFIWPLQGKQSSGFGWRNDPFSRVRSFHAGLDISTPTGTAVKASADGKVTATGYNAVYGNFVIISHSEDYQTMYAHLHRILVKKGNYVNQGAIVALSGNSGRSTGPHLHFAVYKNKRAVNPLEALKN